MFPFTDMVRAKRRPALILLNAGDDDILIARVTSAPAASEFDVTLTAWSAAGLLLPSTVRLHKLATLEKRLAERSLGELNTADKEAVSRKLKSLWNLN